jgi:hypothetical protein
MANEAMAQAVLDHAHQYYDVGNWYVVAECWDLWSVLEELDRCEAETQVAFHLDTGAISHFAAIIRPKRTWQEPDNAAPTFGSAPFVMP